MIDNLFKKLAFLEKEIEPRIYSDILELICPYINIEKLTSVTDLDYILPTSLQVVYYYKPKKKYPGIYAIFYGDELIKENLIAFIDYHRIDIYVVNFPKYKEMQQHLYSILSETAFEFSEQSISQLEIVLNLFN